MDRILNYSINKQSKMPIAQFLKAMGYSSQAIIALKKMEKSILVNGIWQYTNYLLQPGDRLTIHITEKHSSESIKPVNLPFPVIYEDEDILVIDKPSNMPIHPSLNNYENTLANAAAYYFASRSIPFTFRCINRLDRDTTGLTILAKHKLSAGILSKMVQERLIKREYLAIASGSLSQRCGSITAPIARKEGSSIERCVDWLRGESAVTHYRVIKEFQKYISNKVSTFTLLSLHLETGRTHQIRVHMQYLGCPLAGDFLYNPDIPYLGRQALHSCRLEFMHPITKKEMLFTAPLPDDMLTLFGENADIL